MMGNYSYGNLMYDYRLEINLEDMVEQILRHIGADGADWYFDDTKLVIEGTDKCRYKHWHCDATRYEPSEDDTELLGSMNEKDIEQAVSEAISVFKDEIKHKYISELTIHEDSFEYEADEQDPDAAYEAWRDRQLEDWDDR